MPRKKRCDKKQKRNGRKTKYANSQNSKSSSFGSPDNRASQSKNQVTLHEGIATLPDFLQSMIPLMLSPETLPQVFSEANELAIKMSAFYDEFKQTITKPCIDPISDFQHFLYYDKRLHDMLGKQIQTRLKEVIDFLSNGKLNTQNHFVHIHTVCAMQLQELNETLGHKLLELQALYSDHKNYLGVVALGFSIVEHYYVSLQGSAKLFYQPIASIEALEKAIEMVIDAAVKLGRRNPDVRNFFARFLEIAEDVVIEYKGNQSFLTLYYYAIAVLEYKTNNINHAMDYCLKALETLELSREHNESHTLSKSIKIADLYFNIGQKLQELNHYKETMHCYRDALIIYRARLQFTQSILDIKLNNNTTQRNKEINQLTNRDNASVDKWADKWLETSTSLITPDDAKLEIENKVLARKVNRVVEALEQLKDSRISILQANLGATKAIQAEALRYTLIGNAFLCIEAMDEAVFQQLKNKLNETSISHLIDEDSLTVVFLECHILSCENLQEICNVEFSITNNRMHEKDILVTSYGSDNIDEKQQNTFEQTDGDLLDEWSCQPQPQRQLELDFNAVGYQTVRSKNKNTPRRLLSMNADALISRIYKQLENHIITLETLTQYFTHENNTYHLAAYYHLVRFFQLAHVYSQHSNNVLTVKDHELYLLRNSLLHGYFNFTNAQIEKISLCLVSEMKPRLEDLKNSEGRFNYPTLRLKNIADDPKFPWQYNDLPRSSGERFADILRYLSELKILKKQKCTSIINAAKLNCLILIGESFKEIKLQSYHFTPELYNLLNACQHEFRNRAGHEISFINDNHDALPYDLFNSRDITQISKRAGKMEIYDEVNMLEQRYSNTNEVESETSLTGNWEKHSFFNSLVPQSSSELSPKLSEGSETKTYPVGF